MQNKPYLPLFCFIAITALLAGCNQQNNSISNDASQAIVKTHVPIISEYIANHIESDVEHKLLCGESLPCVNKHIAEFYQARGYTHVWMDNSGVLKPEIESVLNILRNSYQDGLNTPSYHIADIEHDLAQIKTNSKYQESDSQLYVNVDLTMSDAYLSYSKDMQNGRINPVTTYPDWGVDRTTVDVVAQFESTTNNGSLVTNLQNMAPNNNQYRSLKNKLADYNNLVIESGESVLTPADKNTMKQIALNMDRLRWLPHTLAESYILVNIPRFELDIFTEHGESLALSMPVIVGRGGENKTCLVNSSISTVEFNPYWGIPKRIATNEYLVKLRDNPNYLSDRNIRIFAKGNKEVDPTTVDWESVNPKNFKYFFRQDPGVKNALGKVKFIFPNSCGIYLHDTSNRGLFDRDARSMSHGCVRVSKPILLANYLLIDRDQNSATKISKLVKESDHAGMRLKQTMPLYIIYQTVAIDENGNMVHYKDIYDVDNVNLALYYPSGNI